MAGLLDDLMGQLGSGGVGQIASSLGVDEGTATKAISMALPALIGGMANNAAKPDGAEALASALDDHDDSVFGSLGGLLEGGGDGSKILGHVLGAKQPKVEQQIAGQAGLDFGTVAKLLPVLAPLVMGYLSKKKQTDGLDSGGLGSLLQNERKAQEATSPGLGGLASILDADGDGSIMDDVMGMATGGGESSSKGGLGGLLGKLLGRGR